MSSSLSRRKFFCLSGAVAAGCYSASRSFPFELLKACKDGLKVTEQRTAWAIGVGPVGLQAIHLLRQNEMISENREIEQIVAGESSTLHVHNELKMQYLNDAMESVGAFDPAEPVFLIGSTDDPAFHTARDFVKSRDPRFLLTAALAREDYVWPDLSGNESIVTFGALEDTPRITRIILHLYALIARPGVIGVDFSDVRMVLGGGAVRALEYRSPKFDADDLKDFLTRHSKDIAEADGVARIFSLGVPASMLLSQYLEAIIDAFMPQMDQGGDCLLANNFSAADGAFELVLLCRTARTEKDLGLSLLDRL
ncbi:MAG: hypothetical protein ACP5IL_07555 [Syntrophobacteraceae bacterium]